MLGVSSGVLVTALDPKNCVGCHDTLTNSGFVPQELSPDGGSRTTLPRPA